MNLDALVPDRPPATPAALTPLGAKMHAVEVCWRLANPARLVVDATPRLVLSAFARRDCELLLVRVDYPRLGDRDMAGADVEAVLVQVPHVVGRRRLKPEGEHWVYGQEDILASAMFTSERAAERAAPADEVRWYGATVPTLEYNRCPAPCIWWTWRGRVSIPKGASVGVIVRASKATQCKAMLAGV